MSLAYQRELDFMISVLERMRLPVHLLHPEDTLAVLDYHYDPAANRFL